MKINIIGYSGSGKSTLAKYLANYYHRPYLFLDTVNFKENWVERDINEANQMVNDFLLNDSYVIDGNYRKFSSYQRRMEECDQIIFLNFNRFSCLYRALKRYFLYIGKERESSAKGCIEKFDFEFFCWITKDSRTKSIKKDYKQLQQQYPEKFIEIKTQRQFTKFCQQLKRNSK